MVCLNQPDDLVAISVWYDEFPQTTDQQVQHLLTKEPTLRRHLARGEYIL